MRRRRPTLLLASALAAGVLAIGITLASAGHAPASTSNERRTESPIVLRGNGLGSAHFGESERVAIPALEAVLGPARSSRPVAMGGNCTIDAGLQWSTITAYFLRGDFVGYATESLLGDLGARRPDATTQRGLRIGDTLARARRLYAGRLKTSYEQGGSWTATTPDGRLAGYLTSEVGSTHPAPLIADVTSGSVGCPAASP
ncbi:MAG TPA: hypothetical protein VHS57_00995 [Acidimicrobiales bacterium]|jgi:hypothetical protein|nr:hypothetical protein [Acidimicrobiales bacterium]